MLRGQNVSSTRPPRLGTVLPHSRRAQKFKPHSPSPLELESFWREGSDAFKVRSPITEDGDGDFFCPELEGELPF